MLISHATCQQKYLAIYYFKYAVDGGSGNNRYATLVPSLDAADFFRVLLPASEGDKRFNVQEYYTNGKIKLIGKTLPEDTIFMSEYRMRPDGACATYYPDGKKQSIINYANDVEHGNEYLFFPSGKVYQYMINEYHITKRMDCYDINGNQICSDGNGQWIDYDNKYKEIAVQGPVVKGYREGEWRQPAQWPDSVAAVMVYKKDILADSYGLDRKGVKYPFTESYVRANIKGGPSSYIQSVKSHLKLPSENEKAMVDTMHISFIVEKDGSMSHYDVLGIVPDDIKNAIIDAMKQSRNWTQTRLYGVPLKTQIILPMSFKKGYIEDKTVDTAPKFYGGIAAYRDNVYYHNDLQYYERILPDN